MEFPVTDYNINFEVLKKRGNGFRSDPILTDEFYERFGNEENQLEFKIHSHLKC